MSARDCTPSAHARPYDAHARTRENFAAAAVAFLRVLGKDPYQALEAATVIMRAVVDIRATLDQKSTHPPPVARIPHPEAIQ